MDAVVEQTTTNPRGETDESSGANTRVAGEHLGGKYLTFLLDGEEYGVGVLKVREIIGMLDVTTVPQTPEYVRGVINLRGRVIPVVDLRQKFGLPPTEYNEQTCVIVVEVGTLMGIIVDTVSEVHDIPATRIQPPPEMGTSIEAGFILGMGMVEDRIKILLDIDEVLTRTELVVSRATAEAT